MRVPHRMVALTVLTTWAVMSVGMKPDAAQTTPRPSPAAKAAEWTPRRTPWGDPDLQGTFSNGDEYTTPLERPDQFAGRRLEDIKGQELADIRRAQLAQVIDGLPGGRVRGPDGWWVQNINAGNGCAGVAGDRSARREDSSAHGRGA